MGADGGKRAIYGASFTGTDEALRLTTFTNYYVQVESVITHRPDPSDLHKSQFLIRWKSDDATYPPLSWHPLSELGPVLHLIQQYVATYRSRKLSANGIAAPSIVKSVLGTKRKLSFGSENNHGHQLLTPRTSSPSSIAGRSESSTVITSGDHSGPVIFNAYFQRRCGQLFPVSSRDPNVAILDARTLPTKFMLTNASESDLRDADQACHNRYISRLKRLPGPPVQYRNDIDEETPSLAFQFISKYVLRPGVSKRDDLMLGCRKCSPNMGGNRGCEYTKRCDCLEFAAADIDKMDAIQRADYERRLADGDSSMSELPKRFPYISTGHRANCLVDFYLSERHPIYECNAGCACGPRCKNRNVQHGRKVPLEIFKTHDNRGFGLRCLVPLRRGQFIDVYLGEVITDAEATERESRSGPGKASYLFSLDKFAGTSVDGVHSISEEDCYVVDGQFMGGPTRFMNHCCQPNVQMHTVSYNKYDFFVYDLAFFACEDVPAGQELTFDYRDADDVEATDAAMEDDGKTKVPCLCGAERCRGYLWT